MSFVIIRGLIRPLKILALLLRNKLPEFQLVQKFIPLFEEQCILKNVVFSAFVRRVGVHLHFYTISVR